MKTLTQALKDRVSDDASSVDGDIYVENKESGVDRK